MKPTLIITTLVGTIALLMVTLEGSAVSAQANTMNRQQVLDAIGQAEIALKQTPDSTDVRLQLAQLHYQAGHFETAEMLLAPLLGAQTPALEAIALMAELEYLAGNYTEAERILTQTMRRYPDDLTVQVIGNIKLGLIYYQTNQYKKAVEAVTYLMDLQAKGAQIDVPGLQEMVAYSELLRSFGDEPPYQIDWNNRSKSIVPLLLRDPLPVLQVEVANKPIYVFIDTGGDMLFLDTDVAAALGIKAVATFTGTYAGGLTNETGLARAESLKIGEVTLRNIPVQLLPTQRLTDTVSKGQFPISGIIGTNVLKQFLATIDYPNNQLILRPRTDQGRAGLTQELSGKSVTTIAFHLSQTHYMVANGSLNNREALTFFVDSGLATGLGGPSFALPIQTLQYLGITPPKTSATTGVGGGTGTLSVATIPLACGGLGKLIRKDVSGIFGLLSPESYLEQGFILDGLISHNYLRNYAWTLDFDSMTMSFTSPD